MFVKDLLIESLARAGHVKRSFPVPAEELAKAEGFLNSSLRKYNGDNLITAFQKVYTFTPDLAEGEDFIELAIGKPSFRKGVIVHHCVKATREPNPSTMYPNKDYLLCDYNTAASGQPVAYGKKCVLNGTTKEWQSCNISEFCIEDSIPDNLCYEMGSNVVNLMVEDDFGGWTNLDFKSLSEFYSSNELLRYNYAGSGENKVIVRLPAWVSGKKVRIVYNCSTKLGMNDYVELPEDQIEMLTLSVTVALLAEDGDSDGAKLNEYKTQLTGIIENISARNTSTRRIQRSANITARRSYLAGSVFGPGWSH